ncbi:hypothetical protein [Lentibacillus sp. Marseille-P4043]|uniref:hypothetical protein n=1 Tax=Lentibacillus sp. Marseille-P4043 TaxID=2040293 RepID=UPI00131A5F76|nr:hypothetical protein [Lentibacillus sp. Marseille-P4043]
MQYYFHFYWSKVKSPSILLNKVTYRQLHVLKPLICMIAFTTIGDNKGGGGRCGRNKTSR